MNHDHPTDGTSFFRSRSGFVLSGFLIIGAFFLIAEHQAHLVPYARYLPWLLFLACPIMHLFHGHGDHGHSGEEHNQPPKSQ